MLIPGIPLPEKSQKVCGLRANHENICSSKMTGIPANREGGKGMKIPCTLNFSGQEICINVGKKSCNFLYFLLLKYPVCFIVSLRFHFLRTEMFG